MHIENIEVKDKMVLSRVIGHPEIKGSEGWVIGHECFICSRW